MRKVVIFLSLLTFTFGLRKTDSMYLDEVDQNKKINQQLPTREKRASFLDKLKKKRLFQKYVDDGLSADTEKLWGHFIKEMKYDYVKNEGDSVEFPCDSKVTRAIYREYPKSTYRWSVNEEPVAMDTSRMFLFKGTFSIRDLKYEDAGVYVCIIEYRKQDFKTVGIYPLTVKTEKVTHAIRRTDDLELSCNSNIFSLNYPEVIIEWFFNERKYNTPNNNGSETLLVKKVETNSEGVWSCVVKNPKNSKIWHSAWYNVSVEAPPPFHEQIYKIAKEHKLYTGLGVLGFILVLFIILGICVCTANRTKAKNERNMGAMKDHVMSMQGDNLFGINNMNFEMASDSFDDTLLSMYTSSEADTYSESEVTTDESSRLMPMYNGSHFH